MEISMTHGTLPCASMPPVCNVKFLKFLAGQYDPTTQIFMIDMVNGHLTWQKKMGKKAMLKKTLKTPIKGLMIV
jgi:hypothetical protein